MIFIAHAFPNIHSRDLLVSQHPKFLSFTKANLFNGAIKLFIGHGVWFLRPCQLQRFLLQHRDLRVFRLRWNNLCCIVHYGAVLIFHRPLRGISDRSPKEAFHIRYISWQFRLPAIVRCPFRLTRFLRTFLAVAFCIVVAHMKPLPCVAAC
ncbi:hypothetical protein D3C73_1246880 [compost metagenome]